MAEGRAAARLPSCRRACRADARVRCSPHACWPAMRRTQRWDPEILPDNRLEAEHHKNVAASLRPPAGQACVRQCTQLELAPPHISTALLCPMPHCSGSGWGAARVAVDPWWRARSGGAHAARRSQFKRKGAGPCMQRPGAGRNLARILRSPRLERLSGAAMCTR